MNPVRNIKYTRRKKISNGVKVTISNLQKKIPLNPKRIKAVILKVLSQEGVKKSGEITVCFVTDRKIKELNLKYLNKNRPTDVLAFDLSTAIKMEADIVISTDTAIRNAKIFKTLALYEIYLYLIHGILHLLGYDDLKKKDRLAMQKRQEELLCPSTKPKP